MRWRRLIHLSGVGCPTAPAPQGLQRTARCVDEGSEELRGLRKICTEGAKRQGSRGNVAVGGSLIGAVGALTGRSCPHCTCRLQRPVRPLPGNRVPLSDGPS